MRIALPKAGLYASLLILVLFLLGNSNNPPNGRTGAPGDQLCSSCHSSGSMNGTISLSGLPANIQPNTTYSLTLTSTLTSGNASTAGFQIVALNSNNQNAGDMIPIGSDVGTNTSGGREYMEQRGDKSINGGQVSWNFDWESPASATGSGDITFYASAVLANNNGSTSGDRGINTSFITNLSGGGGGGLPVTISIVNTNNVDCFGDNSGSATAFASGGNGTLSYNWSNGQSGPTVSNLSAGTYTVTASDGSGNAGSTSVTITQPNSPLNPFPTSQNNVLCFNENTGSASVSAVGGTPPYSYAWSNGAQGNSVSNLGAGLYTVTVTDGNNCTETETFNLSQPTQLIASNATVNSISCAGESDGGIILFPSGGTPPYIANWSNGTSGTNISNLSAGTYTVSVTDVNQCEAIASYTIQQPSALNFSPINVEDADCFGENSGSATVQASGGTAPLSISWSNGAAGSTVSNLAAGTYSAIVTDANNCTETLSVTIGEPAALAITTFTSSDVSCFGDNDGNASIQAQGGTAPYSYEWSNGESGSNVQNLSAGSYTASIIDANGCSFIQDFTIHEPAALSTDQLNITAVDCNGEANGAIELIGIGGTAPYTYQWSNGANGPSINNLIAGTYTLTITDAQQCSFSTNFLVEEPSALAIDNILETDVACFGEANGSAEIIASGGTAPYAYQWSTGSINSSLNGLSAGTYVFTVTDSNGCSTVSSATINEPAPLVSVSSTVEVDCFGASTGSASISSQGGTPPYSYEWSNGQNGANQNNLAAGTYTVTIEDANSCIEIQSLEITEPQPLSISSPSVSSVLCFGEANGSIELSPAGGTAPYQADWSNGGSGLNLSNLAAGSYQVTITDANLCTLIETINIDEPEELVTIINSTDESASGTNDGTANAIPSGGMAPFNFQWSNGENTAAINNLAPDTYQVTITDANGCTTVAEAIINPFDCGLAANVVSVNISCAGEANGAASINTQAGTAPFSFVWSNGANTSTIENLTPGFYTVTITDASNCGLVETIEITEPAALSSSFDIANPICAGESNGSATVEVVGGTAPFSYFWSNDATTPQIDGLPGGTYSLTITDANNCALIESITLEEPIEVSSTLLIEEDATCPGEENGLIEIEANGGTGILAIEWSNGASGPLLVDIGAGTYTATITDENGCTAQTTVSIDDTDTAPPTAIENSLEVALDANGLATVLPIEVGSESFDNCSEVTLALSQTDFTCADIGAQSVLLTVTDAAGNESSITATIDVVDLLPPTIDCPSDIVSNNCGEAINYTIDAQDNCEITSVNLIEGLGSGAVFPVGITTESYEVIDASGNATVCSFTITVESTLEEDAPTLVEPCFGAADGAISLNVLGGTPSYSFEWDIPNVGDVSQVSNLAAGTYSYTVTDAGGCVLLGSIDLDALPAIELTDIEVTPANTGQANGAIDISVSGGQAPYQYTWTLDGTLVSEEEDPSQLAPGTYIVSIEDANGCSVSSEEILLEELTNTAELSILGQLTIAPNPTSGRLEIIPEGLLDGTWQVRILDLQGRTVWARSFTQNLPASISVELSEEPAGIYWVQMIHAEGILLRKVVKQ
ncbi:MAG: choice-of-anchor V domain-containing protein [Bacteroidota bacterium]